MRSFFFFYFKGCYALQISVAYNVINSLCELLAATELGDFNVTSDTSQVISETVFAVHGLAKTNKNTTYNQVPIQKSEKKLQTNTKTKPNETKSLFKTDV